MVNLVNGFFLQVAQTNALELVNGGYGIKNPIFSQNDRQNQQQQNIFGELNLLHLVFQQQMLINVQRPQRWYFDT